jgi:hypothetical protein
MNLFQLQYFLILVFENLEPDSSKSLDPVPDPKGKIRKERLQQDSPKETNTYR